MSAERFVLAIDLGTSGPKVAVVSTRGRVVACETEPVELLLFPGGGAEQRPDDWWRAIVTAAKRARSKSGIPAGEIVAVSCTSQWSGTVPVGKDGKALSNAVIWMDTRGAKYLGEITGGPVRIDGYGVGKLVRWLRLTGGIPGHSGKDPIAHILYLRHEHPQVYEQTHMFLEPKDYLNLRLTGEFAASYDSIALHWMTDNRQLRRVDYDAGLVEMSSIERSKLPPLRRAVDLLAPLREEVAAELGLRAGIDVFTGTPDVQSAAVGSGAVRDYDPHLYVGTSSWLTCHVPFKKTDIVRNMASLPSAIPERYFVANEQETAGACVSFLIDNLLYPRDELSNGGRPLDVFRRLEQMVERTPAGSDKMIFLPWLYGERTPVEDPYVRGGFFNQSLQTERRHMVRAVYEGVAYNARWLLGGVEHFVSRRFDSIAMIGGGANSAAWCQIHADVLNRPILRVKNPVQANVRGAALIAGVGLGDVGFDDVPECVEIAQRHEPDSKNRAVYDQLFGEFVTLYRKNKPAYARLNSGTVRGH